MFGNVFLSCLFKPWNPLHKPDIIFHCPFICSTHQKIALLSPKCEQLDHLPHQTTSYTLSICQDSQLLVDLRLSCSSKMALEMDPMLMFYSPRIDMQPHPGLSSPTLLSFPFSLCSDISFDLFPECLPCQWCWLGLHFGMLHPTFPHDDSGLSQICV